jgi:hypothetical protein
LRRFLCEFYCSTILERPAGFEPACTSFVAKAINPLWHGRLKSLVGELRIELSPRAPKARMQRIHHSPMVPAQRVERCSLRFQRSVSTAHTRLAKFGGPCGNRTHLTILLAKQATTPSSPTARNCAGELHPGELGWPVGVEPTRDMSHSHARHSRSRHGHSWSTRGYSKTHSADYKSAALPLELQVQSFGAGSRTLTRILRHTEATLWC